MTNDSKTDLVFEAADEAMWNVHGGSRTWEEIELRAALAAAEPLIRQRVTAVLRSAVADIEIQSGSEHWKHGRETMQGDALAAIDRMIEAECGVEW